MGGFLKTNINLEEFRRVADWFQNYLKPIVAPQTQLGTYITKKISKEEVSKKEIVNILKKADFNISDIIIQKNERQTNLLLEHTIDNISYNLPINAESEGTKRFYGFAGLLALLIKTPTIFPIDELESSLHPDLYTHFLLSFLQKTQHSQLSFIPWQILILLP